MRLAVLLVGTLAVGCATPYIPRSTELRLVRLEESAGCTRSTCIVPQLPHTAEITAVEVTADGRTLFTGGREGTVKQWDLESGLLVRTFRGLGAPVMALATTADGRRLIVAWGSRWTDVYGRFDDEAVRIFDVATGAVLHQLVNHGAETLAHWPDGQGNADWRALLGGAAVHSGTTLPDGRVAKPWSHEAGRYDVWVAGLVGGGAVAQGTYYANPPPAEVAFDVRFLSPFILEVTTRDGSARQLDLRTVSVSAKPAAPAPTERPVWSVEALEREPAKIRVGASEKDQEVALRAWDPEMFQSHDGKRVAATYLGRGPSGSDWDTIGLVAVIDVARHAVLGEVSPGFPPGLVGFGSRDGTKARPLAFVPRTYDLVRAGASYLDVLDGRTLTPKIRLDTSAMPTRVDTSPDGRFVAAAQDDGTVFIGRLDGRFGATFIFSKENWLVVSPDGRFEASRRGSALAAASARGRGSRLDQLALRDNRPDLLVEGFGVGAPEVVAYFRARVERRQSKLGLDGEGALDATLDAGARVAIRSAAVAEPGAFVDLAIELEHDTSPLRAYSVYVNEVRVTTRTGSWAAGRKHTLTERVELVAGPNRIEVGALDARGVESLRAIRTVEGVSRAEPELWYLGYGVSRYRDPSLNLAYAHKDAEDLRTLFAQMQAKATHTKVYTDEQVTLANLRAGKAFLAKAKADDVIVVFVAGHGVHAGRTADYYYLTHDTDLSRLTETAAPFEAIEDLFDGLTSRHKLFLMDTCESGERDDAEIAPLLAAAAPRTRARAVRGLIRKSSPEKRAARPFVFERNRYVLNDLARRTGTVVYSSSRGDELSFELDELQNGAFTHALRAALTDGATDTSHDGRISLEELRAVVEKDVAVRTHELQHPTVDRDNPEAGIALWLDPRSEAKRLRAEAATARTRAAAREESAVRHDYEAQKWMVPAAAYQKGMPSAPTEAQRQQLRELREKAAQEVKAAADLRTWAKGDLQEAALLEARAAAIESKP